MKNIEDKYVIREAQLSDLPALIELAKITFIETFKVKFAIPYSEDDLREFFGNFADPAVFSSYISDAHFHSLVVESPTGLVGYCISGPSSLPHSERTPSCGELKKIYLLESTQGKGLGGQLLKGSMKWLEEHYDRLWIGVWSGNEKAKEIYYKLGFEKVGEYDFLVGNTRDREFILSRHPATHD